MQCGPVYFWQSVPTLSEKKMLVDTAVPTLFEHIVAKSQERAKPRKTSKKRQRTQVGVLFIFVTNHRGRTGRARTHRNASRCRVFLRWGVAMYKSVTHQHPSIHFIYLTLLLGMFNVYHSRTQFHNNEYFDKKYSLNCWLK